MVMQCGPQHCYSTFLVMCNNTWLSLSTSLYMQTLSSAEIHRGRGGGCATCAACKCATWALTAPSLRSGAVEAPRRVQPGPGSTPASRWAFYCLAVTDRCCPPGDVGTWPS